MRALEQFPLVTPFLWFDQEAEQAADFYCSIFPNSRRLDAMKDIREDAAPARKVLTVSFELDGQKFTAMNGGPHVTFNEAISFVIRCETQEQIDHYWSRLTADGGAEIQCGWLKDRFGVRWQVTPSRIGEWVSTPAGMQAMMKMKKLVIADLEAAAKQ